MNFKSLGVTLGYRYEQSPVIVYDGTAPTPYETANYVPTARPGHRAPHYSMPDGAALYDRFGSGFTLLALDESAVSAIEKAACDRGVPLTVLRCSDPRLRDLYEAGLVLIRPDQHVAWRSDRLPAEPAALMDTICGA